MTIKTNGHNQIRGRFYGQIEELSEVPVLVKKGQLPRVLVVPSPKNLRD
jgi:hypothetical protein